jgi:anti-sigma regulatory factor (Ser/Thr protein kinase)
MSDSAWVSTSPAAFDLQLTLARDLASAAAARQFTEETLASGGYRGHHADVVLVVSELVANALLHGDGAPLLRLAGAAGWVRVEVSDHSSELPAMRPPAPAGGGWGLHLVDRLTAGWGAVRRGIGKVVWCELRPAAESTAAAAA